MVEMALIAVLLGDRVISRTTRPNGYINARLGILPLRSMEVNSYEKGRGKVNPAIRLFGIFQEKVDLSSIYGETTILS